MTRSSCRYPVAVVLAVIVLGWGCGGGGRSEATGPVTVVAMNCPSGNGTQAGTTCQLLRVEYQNNAAIEAEVRITEPNPGVPFRGTVILGSGSSGTDFIGDLAGGGTLVGDLLNNGFRVVDRRWRSGWFETSQSIRQQSARYAALLSWVRDQVHTTGALIAIGNSGGAAEIAYALTTWDRDTLLDAVILCGGPPLTRLDYLCDAPSTPEWSAQCEALVPPNSLECGSPSCNADNGLLVCNVLPPNPLPGQRRNDSILHGAAKVSFPGTYVHGVLGLQDCTDALPQAMLFLTSITASGGGPVIEYVPGTPHFVPTTAAGRQAIVQAALVGATVRRGAATVTIMGWPRTGGRLGVLVSGEPGTACRVLVGLGREPSETPLGWCFVRDGVAAGDGVLGWADGRAAVWLDLPPNPALTGLTLYCQALAGGRFSNVARCVVAP